METETTEVLLAVDHGLRGNCGKQPSIIYPFGSVSSNLCRKGKQPLLGVHSHDCCPWVTHGLYCSKEPIRHKTKPKKCYQVSICVCLTLAPHCVFSFILHNYTHLYKCTYRSTVMIHRKITHYPGFRVIFSQGWYLSNGRKI